MVDSTGMLAMRFFGPQPSKMPSKTSLEKWAPSVGYGGGILSLRATAHELGEL